jgi:hypothetical protein
VALSEWLACAARADLAARLRAALRACGRLSARMGAMDRCARFPVAGLLTVAALGAIFYAPAPPARFRADYDPRLFPAAALAELRARPAGRIFTSDQWGDYLIYRLWPEVRVFVDGRSDFYGPALEQAYLDVLHVCYDWQARLDSFGIDTVLLPPDMPLAGVLKESRRWRAVYDDGRAIVFRAEPVSGGPTAGKSRTIPLKERTET